MQPEQGHLLLFLRQFACLLLLALPLLCKADSLRYEVEGVDGAVMDNINAWLGPAPETPEERLNFVVSAESRVEQSVQALGYYQSDIDIVVDRSRDTWRMLVTVSPNEPVRIRDVQMLLAGAAVDDPVFADLIAQLPLASGNVFHHGKYEAFKRSLQALGQRRGYFDGRLTLSQVRVDQVAGTADVS